jgi:hypothetical protein
MKPYIVGNTHYSTSMTISELQFGVLFAAKSSL